MCDVIKLPSSGNGETQTPMAGICDFGGAAGALDIKYQGTKDGCDPGAIYISSHTACRIQIYVRGGAAGALKLATEVHKDIGVVKIELAYDVARVLLEGLGTAPASLWYIGSIPTEKKK